MMTSNKLMPAIWGGVFIGVLSSLPFVSACCCLWVIGGGVLAVYLLQQNQLAPITTGDGVLVGLFAGLIGFVVSVVLAFPLQMLLAPLGLDMHAQWTEAMRELPPEGREWLERIGIAPIMALAGIIGFLTYAVLAPLGGLLGVLIFQKKAPPAPLPPSPPPFEPPSPLA